MCSAVRCLGSNSDIPIYSQCDLDKVNPSEASFFFFTIKSDNNIIRPTMESCYKTDIIYIKQSAQCLAHTAVSDRYVRNYNH